MMALPMLVAIGEVVWDIFPDRRVLGGAPVNVAYHLLGRGEETAIITRVGRDELGMLTRKRFADLELPTAGVQAGDEPTGTVRVSFTDNGEPRFAIATPAAWDAIEIGPALNSLGDRPIAVIYGTLAQRDSRSRNTIRQLWARAEERIYDVNLRPPFTSMEVVLESLEAADLVKMNGAEVAEIGGWLGLVGLERNAVARELLDRYNIAVLVVTEGADGAWLVTRDGSWRDPGRQVAVADPVGAGDAFLAGLLAARRAGSSWPACLVQANALGAYVAGQPGATPPHPFRLEK